MTINKTQDKGKLIITLDGKLDATTAPEFQDALIPAFDDAKEIVLDFEKLNYIASAGLRVLLAGHKKSFAKDVPMKIINVSEDITEIFHMTGFASILSIM